MSSTAVRSPKPQNVLESDIQLYQAFAVEEREAVARCHLPYEAYYATRRARALEVVKAMKAYRDAIYLGGN